MKQAADSFRFFHRLSTGLMPLVLLAAILPVLVLIFFGFYALIKHGYMFYFTGFLALCAIIGASGFWLVKKKSRAAILDEVDESMVQPAQDWSEFDLGVWEEANQHILALLKENSLWSDLGGHAKSTAIFVAEQYHEGNTRKELAFTAIELLKMMEEVSRRYRLTLKEHVPYIEKVNISTLKFLYDHKDKASTAGKIWNLYRTYRVFTPYGLLAEARGYVIGRMFSGVSQELQFRLKTAFLQEVASVAIDLYSGRFKFDDQSLEEQSRKDAKNMAVDPEPLRICLVGQVSAGKSAVINALTGYIRAEVNRLPSTDRATIYKCSIDDMDVMHLVDLPGLDGQENNDRFLLEQVMQSDMVLWVFKASQSSRAFDTAFYAKIRSFYTEPANRSRRMPVFIGVLTHIDRLKPVHEWHPPYNLKSPDTPKAQTIKQALEYNKSLFKMNDWIPVCIAPDKEQYNVQQLGAAIAAGYESAQQTQFNRARLSSEDQAQLSESLKRLKKTATIMFEKFSG